MSDSTVCAAIAPGVGRRAEAARVDRAGGQPDEALLDLSASSEVLMALTTEHFTLQGARAATTSESTARAGLYVGALSSRLKVEVSRPGPWRPVACGSVMPPTALFRSHPPTPRAMEAEAPP
jgi:hypothetical protein